MWLFLDDERYPSDVTWVDDVRYSQLSWVIVRSYDEFVTFIEDCGLPEFVSFDHDLADEHYQTLLNAVEYEVDDGDLKKTFTVMENTGYTCAKWLVEYCQDNGLKFPEYVVHSMNPIGKENIEGLITNAQKVLGI